MRLIDADALIPSEIHTVVVRKADGKEVWESVLYAEQIDNAPTVDVDSLNAKHEDIGYEKGYRDGYAEALYETDNAEPMPTIEPAITYEQVKEYCRKRCLVIVTAEEFNDMNAIWNLLQPDDNEEGKQK